MRGVSRRPERLDVASAVRCNMGPRCDTSATFEDATFEEENP